MAWMRKVRDGDFSAIPPVVSFEEASQLALLIDGYEIVGGFEAVFAIARRVFTEVRNVGRTRASALDLWITLFAQQRAHRNDGLPPTEEDEFWMQELVRLLRGALLSLGPKQKAGIMALLRNDHELEFRP